MPVLRKPLLLLILLVPHAVRADDLDTLVHQYTAALKKVRGPLNQRPGLAVTHVRPVLDKIGGLSTSASERWLAGELDNVRTAICVRESIPRVLFAASGEKAAKILLQGLGKRPPEVRKACLKAVEKSGGPLGFDDVKLLLQQLGASSSRLADAGFAKRLKPVIGILKKTKDEAARTWLAGEAYSLAGRKKDCLYVLARLAAELKLEGARDELVNMVDHRSRELAITAIEALAKLGGRDAFKDIGVTLDKPGADVRMRVRALDALVASEGGVEFVIQAASGKDPELRAIAMGSLGLRVSEPRVMKVLFGGLEDMDASVRNVALRTLRKARSKSVIGVLINIVGTHSDESFRLKALELLVNVSGQNFGLAAADWKKWWAQSEAIFEFPKPDEEGITSVKKRGLEYFGIEVSSKRLGLIADISGSMRQMVAVKAATYRPEGGVVKNGKARKIDILKKEMLRLLKALPADTSLNIITFDAAYKPWQKALQPLRGRGRSRALGYVARIVTGSGTNVFDTLEFALKDKRIDTIYLLTDGLPTRGRITAPAAILKEIDILNRARGVTIHTIAFGKKSDLLKQLAERSGGQYRFVDKY